MALKLLQFPPLEPAARSLERLQHEVRAASSVVHPNIVPVLDLGLAEGVPFIEMELIKGPSLRERVEREGPFDPARACRLCAQALEGLGAVHARGIVHGDVKPANVLLDTDGAARLTDFGISRLLGESTTVSGTERVVGSPHFMAPEQWRGGHVRPAADLYAAGLLLYYSLTGQLPYGHQPRLALMYKHLHEPLLEPGECPPLIPEYLAEVIRRAVEKQPRARFANAAEFAAAVEMFLSSPFGPP